MTDTDKIRAAFEDEVSTYPLCIDINADGYYESLVTHNAWMAFKSAYAQGQRDLIASCGEPVAYQVISHNGWNDRLYPTKDAPPGFAEFLETERRVGNTVRALYSLPEGVQK